MRLGMNMLLWTTHVTERHYPLFPDLQKTGFEGIEIPVGSGDETYYRSLGERLADLGLARTGVFSVGAEHNAVSPDPAVRRAAVQRIAWAAEMTAALGGNHLGGPFHSAYAVFSGQPPTADERSWCVETLRAAAEAADALGVTLAIEPLNRFECYMVTTAGQGAEIVRRVDHPRLRMLYDTHHMHIEEKDMAASILDNAAVISHVHISENDRGVPGSGQLDWQGTFGALEQIDFDGWLMIEAFSRLEPEFGSIVRIWRELHASPEEVYRGGYAFVRRMLAET